MKYLSLIILLSLIFTLESEAQLFIINKKVIIGGYIIEEDSKTPVPFANIYVKKTRKGTITDTSGFFVLNANFGDTIIVSSIGYQKERIYVNDSILSFSNSAIIPLRKKVYELASVDIIALRRYEQLKYDFTHLELPETQYDYALENFPIINEDYSYYNRRTDDFGLVIGGPITALYNLFSKEGKATRKLIALKEKDKINDAVEQKYNIDIVKTITGYNDKEAKEFMDWCNISDNIILRLKEYQIIEIILHKNQIYSAK